MKKNLIIMIVFMMVLLGCQSANQRLAKKMINKYSDVSNYILLPGEVIEVDGNSIIIKCVELKEYIGYEDDFCDFYVFSRSVLDLNIGDQIEFMTVPFHFYSGHSLPIVELKKDNVLLLSFAEGKENLIDWVNTNFK